MRYVKDSPLELGFRVWQLRPPAPSLTVVVKGTFDAAAGDPAPLAEEQVPATGEVYWDDDAERSLRAPSDYPLLKPLGECFVTGKAWAPGGRPAPMVACSFRVGPVEKSFAVLGDRVWTKGLVRSISAPTPFTEMELRMERAYGGPGYAPNPYGRGRVEVDGELPLPNLEQPRALIAAPESKPDPVIVGALPMTWPERRRYAGTYDQRYMRERWPWLPHDFDWRFFLEAPPEQRLREGFWRGDERIEIHNLHPSAPSIRSRLPGIVPRVFLDIERPRQPRAFEEVPLELDMVTWDGAIGKLLLTWRGLVEVPSESLDEIAHLFIAHDPLGGPSRSAPELKARFDALRAEEEAEEREAEGEPPPPEVEEPAPEEPEGEEEAEAEAEEPPSPEELELAAKMAELEAKMAAMGIPSPTAEDDAAPPPPPPDPKELLERLRASGAPVPPEVEQALAELAAPEPEPEAEPEPDEVPEPPPAPEGRALVEARLAAGEPLSELDLTGAELSGMDLSGQDLTSSILRGAKLNGTRLAGARLDGASLAEAEMVRAELGGASLVGADLAGANAQWVDLLGANLEDADLEGARLVEIRLSQAKAARARFVGADLTAAVLTQTDFTEADFERATLDRADLFEANLADATLEDATAHGARFERARMTKSRGAGLRATEARFGTIDAEDSFWERSELSRSDFSFARLTRADFSDAVLIGTRMDGCALRGARFDRANAHSLHAIKSDLMEANFESAVLSFADLRGANLFGAELWRAKTDHVQLELADVTRTKLER
ncbi:MAG: DUF2169 domain-containing protein [Sandaracinaceae bacterium]|nr:DUF2169 domain-containing protein [Sandaracinaceae bacterium]